MYQLTENENIVLYLDTMAFIPRGHRFWTEYEAWVEDGNTPLPVPTPSSEQLADEARGKRNDLLRECDWTQLADNNLTGLERTAWLAYRQLLREVPQQAGFPDNILWPTAPASSPDAGDGLPEQA